MNVTHLTPDSANHRLSRIALLLVSALILALASVSPASANTKVDPANLTAPAISGTASEGHVLTASHGTWQGTIPFSYAYQWQRCNASGTGCTNIAGAKAQTYTVTSADVGSTLRVDVMATNGHGATGMTSAATPGIKSNPSLPTPTPASNGCATDGGTVAVGAVSSPAHLNIDQFQTTPKVVTYGTRSVTAHFHVTACGGSVQGASVYATAVPYNLFAIPGEEVTNAQGWATLKFDALPGFPVTTNQQLLVMFVRATKPGDNILSGLAGRRLVAFHVSKG